MQDLLTVPEAARYLRIDRAHCYELAEREQIPVLRIGRRIVVPRQALEDWIRQNTTVCAEGMGH